MPRPLLLIIYTAVAILAGIVFLKYALPILMTFYYCYHYRHVYGPLIRLLQKMKMSRGVAVLVAMVLVFGSAGVIMSLLVIRLATELIHLSATLPGLTVEVKNYLHVFIEKITAFYVTLPAAITSSIEQSLNSLSYSMQVMATRLANSMLSFISMSAGYTCPAAGDSVVIIFYCPGQENDYEFYRAPVTRPMG
ncbi:MAG: AI-2E family transporter [Candidatus Syntrophopropionicum ammoniitolerans]